MCGGFLGNLIGGILGFGSSNQSETPKVQTKPAEVEDGTAALKAQQDQKKRAANAHGMNSNILGASNTASAATGQKTLLGE